MRIVLRILSGARAGHEARFDAPRVSLGRHPASDLRFDPAHDRDVSGRHAEIVRTNGQFTIRDTSSTNGTWVNGDRIAAPHPLADGDVIAFGAAGPRVEFHAEPSGFQWTARRVWLAATAGTVFAAGIALTFWFAHRDVKRRESALAAELHRRDSVNAALSASVRVASGKVSGLDSALAAARQESESLRARLASGGAAAGEAQQLAHAESREQALLSASRVDYARISRADGPAVVLIAVEMPDGHAFTGTGFTVKPSGLVVTNRHLLRGDDGASATRVVVIFSDTKRWLPAHIVKISPTADLAFLQIEEPGPYPSLTAPPARTAKPAVGSPVAIIGYPLGIDTPMEGSGTAITARSTLSVGTLSKVLSDVIQIDAFAGEGSSGSPVFDRDAHVVGVVYGGAREAAGRIVYAIPAPVLAREIP